MAEAWRTIAQATLTATGRTGKCELRNSRVIPNPRGTYSKFFVVLYDPGGFLSAEG